MVVVNITVLIIIIAVSNSCWVNSIFSIIFDFVIGTKFGQNNHK